MKILTDVSSNQLDLLSSLVGFVKDIKTQNYPNKTDAKSTLEAVLVDVQEVRTVLTTLVAECRAEIKKMAPAKVVKKTTTKPKKL